MWAGQVQVEPQGRYVYQEDELYANVGEGNPKSLKLRRHGWISISKGNGRTHLIKISNTNATLFLLHSQKTIHFDFIILINCIFKLEKYLNKSCLKINDVSTETLIRFKMMLYNPFNILMIVTFIFDKDYLVFF